MNCNVCQIADLIVRLRTNHDEVILREARERSTTRYRIGPVVAG